MTAADIVAIGMSVFGEADVQPIIIAIVGVALFGRVARGLRAFFT